MRVTNPGCYSTGFLATVRPLVRAGLIPADWPVLCNAVSGYSGGGKAMIAEFEDRRAPNFSREVFRTYGLTLEHKHVDEMQTHAGLKQRPLFAPSVAPFLSRDAGGDSAAACRHCRDARPSSKSTRRLRIRIAANG